MRTGRAPGHVPSPEPREGRKVVSRWLTRLIEGECSTHEVLPLAREAGFPSFADLCLAALPERLPRVPFTRAVIRARLGDALEGAIGLSELKAWAGEVHAIAYQHVLGRHRGERRVAASALALIAVAADERVFRTREPVDAVLTALAVALDRHEALPLGELQALLFQGQGELHLATRRPTLAPAGEDEDAGEDPSRPPPEPTSFDPSWADVCARAEPGPFSRAPDPWTGPEPIVAFSVVTAQAADQDALDRRVAAPGLAALVRERAPNFALARYRARIQRDVDGIEEIVLRTPAVDDAAVEHAAKLFALVHDVGAVTLDGRRLATLRCPPARQG